MADLTFVPTWVFLDSLIFIIAMITTYDIIKKEEYPQYVLLEMVCFSLLYAAIFENFATIMGWYEYGRSLIMVGNVTLGVPIVEYLVVYTTLGMLRHMEIPEWCKPLIVGFFGRIFDFSLDPVAVRLRFTTVDGTIGRWTWFIDPSDANIYNVPVYNFSGWVLLCGYAAVFLILGRRWFKRSNYNHKVGVLYPMLSMLAALAVLMSPLSNFLLWLEPIFFKGSIGEWIMLSVFLAAPVVLLLVFWRGRMKHRFLLKENYPTALVFILLPVVNVVFAVVYGFFEILWLELLFAFLSCFLVLLVDYISRSEKQVEASQIGS
ncbi:MAG: carotenoid biosynthesis protein [Candidatus Thorarchaeota archaeon]|nr:carotenoid biosynthesis protein [Candidatus Thorarchaeota archaeon]